MSKMKRRILSMVLALAMMLSVIGTNLSPLIAFADDLGGAQAELISVAGEVLLLGGGDGQKNNPVTASVSVSRTEITTGDVIVSDGAMVDLYDDSDFSSNQNSIPLDENGTDVYIKVTSQDVMNVKYYHVTVTRYNVTLTINKDGQPFDGHGKTFTLQQEGEIKGTGSGTGGMVTFNVTDGTYTIFDGSDDTGKTITVSGTASEMLAYYTVEFRPADIGASSGSVITAQYGGKALESNVVLGGKKLELTAEGRGVMSSPSDKLQPGYSYKWSGEGTNNQTTATFTINNLNKKVDALCTVRGSLRLYGAGRNSADATKAHYPLPEVLTSGQMRLEFDFISTVANPNTCVSLVQTGAAATADTPSMNAIVRVTTAIDAYNGSGWGTVGVPHTANTVYHVKIIVDMTAQTYSAWVTPEGGSETKIATDFAFRAKNPPNIGELRVLDTRNSGNNGITGEIWVENITVSTKPTLTVLDNGVPHVDISAMTFTLVQGGNVKATGTINGHLVTFNDPLADGVYAIYVDGKDTKVTITIKDGSGMATIDLATEEAMARKGLETLVKTIEDRQLREDRHTPETWGPFAAALTAAKAVLADNSATAEALNAAKSNLQNAYAALELISRANGIYKAAYADFFAGATVRTNLGNTTNGATYPNGSYSAPPAGQPNDRSVLGNFHTGSDANSYRPKPGAGVTFPFKIHKDGEYGFVLKFSRVNYEIEDYISVYVNYDKVEKNADGSPKTAGAYRIPLAGKDSELVFVESAPWTMELKEGDTISLVLDTASLDVVDYPDKGLANIDYISVWEVEPDYTYDAFNRNFYLLPGNELVIPEPVSFPLTWSSNNPAVAMVDPSTGLIKALAAGHAVITAIGNGETFTYNLYVKNRESELTLKRALVSLYDMEKNKFDPPAKVRASNASEVPENIPIATSGLTGGERVGNGFVDTMDYVPVGSSVICDVPADVVDKAGLYDITLNYAKGIAQATGQLGLLVNGQIAGTLYTRSGSVSTTVQSNTVTVYLKPGDTIGIRTIVNPKDAVGRFNSLTVTENVVIPPSSVTLSDTSLDHQDQKTLEYTISPANATPAFNWTTDNTDIVSVYGNMVVGENVGEANVTATSIYNKDVKSTAKVTVKDNSSVFSIESNEMKVYLDRDFPRAIQYEMKSSGAKIDGNRTKLSTLRLTTGMTYSLNTSQGLTGSTVKDYTPVVECGQVIQNDDGSQHVIYTLKVNELNAELKLKATVEGTILKFDFNEIKEDPANRIFIIEIPNHNPVTVSNFDANSSFAGSKMESNIGKSGDSFFSINNMLSGSDFYNYAFVSNGNVAAGIKSNAFGLDDGGVAKRVFADTRRNDALVTTSLLSGSWVWRFPDATKKFIDYEGRYGQGEQKLLDRTYFDDPTAPGREKPYVWVVLAENNNGDNVVNWQDAANEFRKVAKVAVGSDKVADAVVQRLIMSQGNETNYPYLSSVDETKRISLHTDGLGQIILQKYHNAGNWGDFSVYDDQLGGLDEFRKFADITTNQYNSFVGVHTNFTEYFAKVDQFSYENVEMQADGITPRSKGYKAFGYYLHQCYVIDDQLDALTRYSDNEASQAKSRYERIKRFKDDIPDLGFIYSDVYSHNGWRGNALARDYEDNGLAYFVEWPYVAEDSAVWAHWAVEKSYSPASLKGYSSDIARFIFNDTKDRWDNYATDNWKTDIEATRAPSSAFLLMGADTTCYEGWVHDGINEYDSIVEKIYRNNLPSKYMQHFPITRMEKDKDGWADYIEFDNGNVKVYAEGYENPNNSTRNSKRIIEKDGKKIYEQACKVGTDQGPAKYLLPWNEGDMQKLDTDEAKEIKLYHWNDEGGSSTWELPDSWSGLNTVYVYELSDLGKNSEKVLTVTDGKVTINAAKRTPYVVYKTPQEMDVDVNFGEGQYVYNPGFSTGNLKGWDILMGDPSVVRNDNEAMPLFTTGGNPAQKDSNADNHGRSRNYELAVKDGNETEVSQVITGLIPGDEYAVSVMVEVQRGKTRKASLVVDAGGTMVSNYMDSSILINYDRYDSKEKTAMLRMRVVFTAEAPTATIRLHAAAGEGEVRFDNVRVYRTTTPAPMVPATDGKIVLYQDFESAPDGTTAAGTLINKPTFEGFFPFNLGNGGGFREARTIMQRRHDPYTQNNTVPQWNDKVPASVREYAQPTKDQSGNTVKGQWWDTTTIPVDLVVDGKTSFSNITGSVGLMYQTTPQSVRFEAGKKYRIGFEYQTGVNGIFAFVLGSGMKGTISQNYSSNTVAFDGLKHYAYLQGTMGPYFGDVVSNRSGGGVKITAMPANWSAGGTYRNIDIKTAVPNWRGYYEYEFVSDSDQTWFGIFRNSDEPGPGENPNPFIMDNLLIVEVGAVASGDATITAGSLAGASLAGDFTGGADIADSSELAVTISEADNADAALLFTRNHPKATVKWVKSSTAPGADADYINAYPTANTVDVENGDVIWVLVTAEDGVSRLYYKVIVSVVEKVDSNDATLSDLTVSPGQLSPVFNPGTTSYTAEVANNVSSITITATSKHAAATVSGAGAHALSVGANTLNVVVTAEDGTQKTYTLTVTRANASSSTDSTSGNSSPTPPVVAPSGNVKVTTNNGAASATVDANTVDALISQANSSAEGQKASIEINVEVSGDVDSVQLEIPAEAFGRVGKADADFVMTTSLGSVTFNSDAIASISRDAGSGVINISIGKADASELPEALKHAVGNRPVYDLSVTAGNRAITSFGAGNATICLPYTLKPEENPNSVVVYAVDDSGALTPVRGTFNASTSGVTFRAPDFANKFMIGYNAVSFNDVKSDMWFYDAVSFAAARNITSGTGNNNFNPAAHTTRAQFISMLLRAYGIEPAASGADNFEDVGNAYYTGYVAKARELGISHGIGNNKFGPDANITRQEMFTMLYNALKVIGELPSAGSAASLTDYTDGNLIAPWAVESMGLLVKAGIVNGNAGELVPDGIATRAQVVQILYTLLSM